RFTGLSNPHQTTPTHEALETLTSVPTYINQHEQIRNPKQLQEVLEGCCVFRLRRRAAHVSCTSPKTHALCIKS
ncbi:MAG: hypothetical protein QXL26_07240, partial [Zestosphaera sp.]